MLKNKFLITAALAATLASRCFAAEPSQEQVSYPNASIGQPCAEDGTISSFTAEKPLICESGTWQSVVFKRDAAGQAKPLYYEGRCSLRFKKGDTKGFLAVAVGNVADICIPANWRTEMIATGDSVRWMFVNSPAVPNMFLLKPIEPGLKATLFIYPVDEDGKMQDKIEVQLSSRHKDKNAKKSGV